MISRKPSIVLLTLDSIRPDHLGCYGYPRDTSPYIDELAGRSVLFSGAVSQGTYTLSSLTSLATSSFLFEHDLYEHTLGIRLNNAIPTSAEILKDNGYSTAFFGPWMVSNIKNFQRGFDVCYTGPRGPLRYVSAGFKRLTRTGFDPTGADAITAKAISWLNRHKQGPFFLWIHYFDAHPPYRVRPPFDSMFVDAPCAKNEARKSFVPTRLIGMGGIPRFMADGKEASVAHYVSKYDAAIRSIDSSIGRLLRFMKKNGLFDDTMLAITSDHGEFLGENDLYFCHGGLPLEPLIRVPLIMKMPGREAKPVRVDEQVRSVDIFPTAFNLSGIRTARKTAGCDLTPIIFGARPHESAFSFFWARHISALRCKDFKLIHIEKDALLKKQAEPQKAALRRGIIFEWKNFLPMQLKFLFGDHMPRYIFYDLRRDPREENAQLDLSSDPDFIKARSVLDAWMKSIDKCNCSVTEDSGGLDLQYLKSLGYAA